MADPREEEYQGPVYRVRWYRYGDTTLGININVARDKLASLVRQGKLEQTPQGTYVISDVEPVPF